MNRSSKSAPGLTQREQDERATSHYEFRGKSMVAEDYLLVCCCRLAYLDDWLWLANLAVHHRNVGNYRWRQPLSLPLAQERIQPEPWGGINTRTPTAKDHTRRFAQDCANRNGCKA